MLLLEIELTPRPLRPPGIVLKKFAQDHHANAVVFSFFRDGGCAIVLFLAALAIEGRLQKPKNAKELAVFALLGVTGMWGNQLFYILGLYYTNPSTASVTQPSIPVFAAIFLLASGAERLPNLGTLHGWCKVLGIAGSVVGAIVIVKGKGHTTSAGSQPTSVGFICLGINCGVMGLYICLQKIFIFKDAASKGGKPFMDWWKKFPVYVTAWSYLFGAIAMIVCALVGHGAGLNLLGFGECPPNLLAKEVEKQCTCSAVCPVPAAGCVQCAAGVTALLKTSTFHIPPQTAIPLVYAIFVSSALCYGLITFANKHISGTVVTAFWPLQVPVAVILSHFVFPGEDLHGQEYAGGAIMIVALLLVCYANFEQEKADKKHNYGSSTQSLLPPHLQPYK